MRAIKKTLASLAVIFVFGFLTSVDAALINGTSFSGDTVIDTVNGLEWLDLDETVGVGMSPDVAISTFGPAGWHWATAAEVTGMLDQFFLANGPDIPSFYPTPDYFVPHIDFSDSQYFAWRSLFGVTAFDFSGGYYDDGVIDGNQEALFWNHSVNKGGPFTFTGGDSNIAHVSYGVFLVRGVTVPEPGSIVAMLSLVSFGAGAVVIRRRRAKKLAA